ncbi:MAG TPA: nuclear transport factor 2 family protein [Chryseolinea sp.]|nr:nuclear transport factor 2 family protein [Chryseolinea sp.]
MRQLITIMVFMPLLGYSQTNKQRNIETEQLDVLATIKKWNTAFAANDPGTYFQFIHDEITLFLPTSPYRVEGKQDDREEFEYSLKKGWTRVGYFQELQPKVQIIGNTAIVTYHNRGTYGDGDNEKTANLKETDVLVKENGNWKVIHIHVSVTN